MGNKVIYDVDPGDGCHSMYEFSSRKKGGGEITTGLFSELDSQWTAKVRGKEALQVLDHGNGLTFYFWTDKGKRKKVELDYNEISVLECFFNYFETELNIGVGKQTIKRMSDVTVI